MNRQELRNSLVQEVDDLLGAGSVGLYEFVDNLRDQPHLTESDMQSIARDALDHMLAAGEVLLEWKIWADPNYSRPASITDVTDDAWSTPTEDPYLAVETI